MNILTISQDMYRDFGLAFPMIPTTFLCLFLCPQQTILNSESHYEATEAFSVGVGGSHSGSQELGHLKTVAFAGARLFEEYKSQPTIDVKFMCQFRFKVLANTIKCIELDMWCLLIL